MAVEGIEGKALREKRVAELRELIRGSQGMVFVSTVGLDSAETFELRKAMRPVKARLKVVKNRLLKVAAAQEQVALAEEWLHNNTTVAFMGDDSVGTVKVLAEYAGAHENLKLKGALVDGRAIGLDGLKVLATIPGRREMHSLVARGMKAPLTRAARDFGGILSKFASLLREAAKKVS